MDEKSTWLRTGPLGTDQRMAVIASVGDTITAEEAAALLRCTVAEVLVAVAAVAAQEARS